MRVLLAQLDRETVEAQHQVIISLEGEEEALGQLGVQAPMCQAAEVLEVLA